MTVALPRSCYSAQYRFVVDTGARDSIVFFLMSITLLFIASILEVISIELF